ncbi:MAG: hypothetical protein U5R46_09665 [Gammaproteobacteria bacterium]|nr:hypothetical protein [Gammaproteobacteria bacterium]
MTCILGLVVRAAGERTEEACIRIAQAQHDSDEFFVVREDSHAGAVEETLVAAARQDVDWVVALDADMLLYDRALLTMQGTLSTFDLSVGVVHFGVADKLYRMRRWGVTVYRKRVVEQGLPVLRKLRKDRNLKIERAMIKCLEKDGTGVEFLKIDVALHDFYQYYRDLYRKAYLNAVRNPGLNERALRCWKKAAPGDPDYKVILQGAIDGLQEWRQLTNSIRDFGRLQSAAVLETLHLKEKAPLTETDIEKVVPCGIGADIRRSIGRNKVAPDYFERPFWSRLFYRLSSHVSRLRLSRLHSN